MQTFTKTFSTKTFVKAVSLAMLFVFLASSTSFAMHVSTAVVWQNSDVDDAREQYKYTNQKACKKRYTRCQEIGGLIYGENPENQNVYGELRTQFFQIASEIEEFQNAINNATSEADIKKVNQKIQASRVDSRLVALRQAAEDVRNRSGAVQKSQTKPEALLPSAGQPSAQATDSMDHIKSALIKGFGEIISKGALPLVLNKLNGVYKDVKNKVGQRSRSVSH
jgi:hypothetical protein